jgi:hypothetical protein
MAKGKVFFGNSNNCVVKKNKKWAYIKIRNFTLFYEKFSSHPHVSFFEAKKKFWGKIIVSDKYFVAG